MQSGGNRKQAFTNTCVCVSNRSQLEQLLHENYLTAGGEENIKCFIREEGFQTGISNVLKARYSLNTSLRAPIGGGNTEEHLYDPALKATGL
jgi:hypothetical protein